MARLAELFLVLAGFDTDLDAQQLPHLAEADVFDQARRFGQRFALLRDACALRDDPIAKAIETVVVQHYLDELAALESATLSELAKVARTPIGDVLFRSAAIMNESVERWERRFDLALQLMTELDPSTVSLTQSIEEVAAAKRLHAGLSDVSALCNDCLEALDRQWLNDLKVILTTVGVSAGSQTRFAAHPSLDGTPGVALVDNAAISAHHLGSERASEVKGLLFEFLDVADENERLIDSVSVPISAQGLLPVLEQVHQNILAVVRSRILHARNGQAMLTFLRNILLLGSSAFVNEFCAAQGDASLALDKFCDADPLFASEVYAHVDPMILYRGDSAALEVRWPLSLLFTADQCVVYYTIHTTFAGIVLALNSIGPGEGPVMHIYRLFLAMLWGEFQASVDAAFAEIGSAIDADSDLTIQSTQSHILAGLVRKMSLDSAQIRSLLQRVIDHVNVRSDTVRPVRDLAHALSKTPSGRDLPLQPFLGLEDR